MDQIIALSSSEEYEEEKQDEIIDNTNITEEESKHKFLAPYVKAPDYSEYNKCNLTNRPDCINLIREVKKTKDLDSSGFMKWLLMRTVPNDHAKILASADQIQQFTEKRQLARWIKEKYLGKDADSIFKQGAGISAVTSFLYGMIFCVFLAALILILGISILIKLNVLNRQKIIYLYSLKDVLISILQN